MGIEDFNVDLDDFADTVVVLSDSESSVAETAGLSLLVARHNETAFAN